MKTEGVLHVEALQILQSRSCSKAITRRGQTEGQGGRGRHSAHGAGLGLPWAWAGSAATREKPLCLSAGEGLLSCEKLFYNVLFIQILLGIVCWDCWGCRARGHCLSFHPGVFCQPALVGSDPFSLSNWADSLGIPQ